MEVPRRAMALGVPAKLRLDAVEPELMIQLGARQYVENGARYRDGLRRIDGSSRSSRRLPRAPEPPEESVVPEAVIVATARTPIGRAFKGSFTEDRADDMAAFIVDAALKKVPNLDRQEVDDLMLGCGLPGGEQGFNMARVVAILAGMRTVPGCTVTRYCSSSLQTIRMAAHAVRAGEGDVFVAAGVEAVSRFMVGGSSDHTPNTQNHKFDDAAARSAARMAGDQGDWTPAEGLPDVYIAMGETAENVAEVEDVSREEMDDFAFQSQQRAGAAIGRGFFEREITPYPSASGTVVSADDCPRPTTEREKLASLAPAFRPTGRVTAGQRVPAERRRRRGGRDERHPRP